METIVRPSSAGSHASVDSQDSSLSWLLLLEGERSQLGHTALVSLYDPETYEQKAMSDESISRENTEPPKGRKVNIKKFTQSKSLSVQTAAERKEMKAKATEVLLKKYKDSPYSRVPLPLDLRQELEKELLAKGQLPIGAAVDKSGNVVHKTGVGKEKDHGTVADKEEKERMVGNRGKIFENSVKQENNKNNTILKMSMSPTSAQNMLERYKKARESDFTNSDDIGVIFESLSVEAKEIEKEQMHKFLQPQLDRKKKWGIPKVETTQEAGKVQGEWKPFCGTEAMPVPGQRQLRFKGKKREASRREEAQYRNFHGYTNVHYEPLTLSQKNSGVAIPPERDPLYRIMREEIARLRKDQENISELGLVTSIVSKAWSENSVNVDVPATICEGDVQAMCQTKLPSPKEWVVLRVVYFLMMTYYEQVIGSGGFSQQSATTLVGAKATSGGPDQNKSKEDLADDATEHSGESSEIHQVHATKDGLIGEIYRHDELGRLWKTMGTIRKRHGIYALNSVDTFSWEDMKEMLTHERAFLSILQHIEVGQEGKPALPFDDIGGKDENTMDLGANSSSGEKYDSYHVFPAHWKSGQFYRSFQEEHYEKLTLLAASTLLHPSYTTRISPPTAYLCQWARRVIAGLFLAHVTVKRLSNKLPLAGVGIKSAAEGESTDKQGAPKNTSSAQIAVKSHESGRSTREAKEADLSSYNPSNYYLVDSETTSVVSGGASQAGGSVASSVLFEAIGNVKSSIAQSSREAYHHSAGLNGTPTLNTTQGMTENPSIWTTIRKVEQFVTSSTLQTDFEGFYKQAQASKNGTESGNLIMALDAPRAQSRDKPLVMAILSPLVSSNNHFRDIEGQQQADIKKLLTDTSSFFTGLAMVRPNDVVDVFVCQHHGVSTWSSQGKKTGESECAYDITSNMTIDREYYSAGLYQNYLTQTSKSPLHAIKQCRKGDDSLHRDSISSSTTLWLQDPSNSAGTTSFRQARATFEQNIPRELVLLPQAHMTMYPRDNARDTSYMSATDLLHYLFEDRANCIATVCKVANFTLTADENTLKFAKKIPFLNVVVVPPQPQQKNNVGAAKYIICVSDYNSSSVHLLNMVLRMAKPSDVILLTHFVSQERLHKPDTQNYVVRLVNEFKARGFNVLVEYERGGTSTSATAAESSSNSIKENRSSNTGGEMFPEVRGQQSVGNVHPFHVQARAIVDHAIVHTPTYICISCDSTDAVHALCSADTNTLRGSQASPKSLPQAILDYSTVLATRTSLTPTRGLSDTTLPKLLMVANNN